jgi:hypothetical protein
MAMERFDIKYYRALHLYSVAGPFPLASVVPFDAGSAVESVGFGSSLGFEDSASGAA